MSKSDILRSRSRNIVLLPSVSVGSSSKINRKSVKEVIDSLLFRLDQQQDIMYRYGDTEAALHRQIASNHHLEEHAR